MGVSIPFVLVGNLLCKDTKTFGTNKGFYLLICQFPKNCLLRINQLYIMDLPYMSVPS